ncbi:Nitrate reductase [Leclercia adecarboxylata]|uniref:Nitrate reductase n=1 Tax=Leclercia adecarboxylata TaxID=83655 RepID=A0A4V6JJ51_9ENTR|nr:Nitrate reductase [Leclercia adecarboxylata]
MRVCQALAACPLVMVSEVMRDTDTSRFAHIRFPALGWGEKEGTVTNSERRISRQRAFLPAPGEAKPDWWIIARIAQRLGHGAAFAWDHPHAIFSEHAALTAFENHGDRQLNLAALAQLTPRRVGCPGALAVADYREALSHARRVQVTPQPHGATPNLLYPLMLNSGRLRDQWHTMTRTGYVPRLMQHLAEPTVDISPQDAARLGVQEGQLTRISAPRGLMVARAKINPGQRDGELFVPMHWNSCFSPSGQGECAGGGALRSAFRSAREQANRSAAYAVATCLAGGALQPGRTDAAGPGVHWWRKATAGVSRMTLAADKPLLEWLMAYCTGQGWQLQIAQPASEAACWPGMTGH